MTREDIHLGDRLWSWNTLRAGRVVGLPDENDDVLLEEEITKERFTEPYYSLMPKPLIVSAETIAQDKLRKGNK